MCQAQIMPHNKKGTPHGFVLVFVFGKESFLMLSESSGMIFLPDHTALTKARDL